MDEDTFEEKTAIIRDWTNGCGVPTHELLAAFRYWIDWFETPGQAD